MAPLFFCAVLATGPVFAEAEFFSYENAPLDEAAVQVFAKEGVTKPADRLRLASYNIENFTDGVGDDRKGAVAESQAVLAAAIIDKLDADVLLLQEVENGAVLELLNSKLARPFALAYISKLGNGAQEMLKLNLAVLSRVPVENVRELDFGPLKGPGRPTRGLLALEIPLPDQARLLVYGMHLKSNFGNKQRNVAQRQHALEIMRKDAAVIVAAKPEYHWEVLAAGDTNVDPDQPSFAHDPSFKPLADWVDFWRVEGVERKPTVPTRFGDPALEFPPATFDRFFGSPDLAQSPWKAGAPGVIPEGTVTKDVKILPGIDGHVSDHYPVFIDIVR